MIFLTNLPIVDQKKSDIFIKWKQNILNDVLHLIVNLITFSRFWTGCTIDSLVPPAIVDILLELADELSSANYYHPLTTEDTTQKAHKQ